MPADTTPVDEKCPDCGAFVRIAPIPDAHFCASPTSQAVTPTDDQEMLRILAVLAHRTMPFYNEKQIEVINWLASRELARRASIKEPK